MTGLIWLLWLLTAPSSPAPEVRRMAAGETVYRIQATYTAGATKDKAEFNLKETVLAKPNRGEKQVSYELDDAEQLSHSGGPLRNLIYIILLSGFSDFRGMSLEPGQADGYLLLGRLHKGVRLRYRYITWLTGTAQIGPANKLSVLYSFDYAGNLLESSVTGLVQDSPVSDLETIKIRVRRLRSSPTPTSVKPPAQARPRALRLALIRNKAQAFALQ